LQPSEGRLFTAATARPVHLPARHALLFPEQKTLEGKRP
jgi:hypothetical protein